MALLQAWPGRGFWQGTPGGQPGTLAGMVQSMAGTSQPHVLSSAVSAFGNFTAAHGFAVNLFAVIVVARRLGLHVPQRAAVAGQDRVLAGMVFCLADWVLVEDFGFFGGLGTDPNSMIPLILLFTAGYLALVPAAQPAPASVGRCVGGRARTRSREPTPTPGCPQALHPAALRIGRRGQRRRPSPRSPRSG